MIQMIINAVDKWLVFLVVCFIVYIVFVIALRYIQREVVQNELYGVGRVADIVYKIRNSEVKNYER